jgi:hypothetical protein
MRKGFWIWRSNLFGILGIISDIDNFEFDQSQVDVIKEGLIGTSDEDERWFDYKFKTLNLKLSFDTGDNDIIHIQLIGDLKEEIIKLLNIIGTDFEIKAKKLIE